MKVEWSDPAIDRLTELYVDLSLDDQRELARSLVGINNRLATDPWEVGESRGANQRVWFSQYLVIHFEFTAELGVFVLKIARNQCNWFQ